MIQRISGLLRGMIALGLPPLRPVLGIVLSCTAVQASMDNARFALHYKPKFVATKQIPSLCDDPATVTEEPNYSPNYTDTPCSSYDTQGLLGPGQIYVVIGKAGTEGVAAVSFGVAYGGSSGQGIDPSRVTWTPCADGLSFPSSDGLHGNFPQPGGGLRITWNLPTSCQTEVLAIDGVHAVVGVFYVYAYSNDRLHLTPNYNLTSGPEAAIMNCAGVTTDLVDLLGLSNVLAFHMSVVGFGSQVGCNTCATDFYPCGGVTPVRATTWGKLRSGYQGNR